MVSIWVTMDRSDASSVFSREDGLAGALEVTATDSRNINSLQAAMKMPDAASDREMLTPSCLGFELAHQRHAVPSPDTMQKLVNQRVDIGDFHRVDDQLNVQIVL